MATVVVHRRPEGPIVGELIGRFSALLAGGGMPNPLSTSADATMRDSGASGSAAAPEPAAAAGQAARSVPVYSGGGSSEESSSSYSDSLARHQAGGGGGGGGSSSSATSSTTTSPSSGAGSPTAEQPVPPLRGGSKVRAKESPEIVPWRLLRDSGGGLDGEEETLAGHLGGKVGGGAANGHGRAAAAASEEGGEGRPSGGAAVADVDELAPEDVALAAE
eukprot:SM008069S22594  [mRNA]  locus=s8069:20:673:+ [translate_table: standard]